MARLPTVNGDEGNWGTVLNTFLSVGHNSDGTLKNPWLNVKDFGALGDGSTDDTAAIQSTIDAAEKGTVILFPVGKYKFSHLTVSKSLTLKGAGWWFGHRPSFGSAGWEAPYVSQEGGTILQCTATSGIAIDVTFSGQFNMQDLFLKGTGNNTSTTIGVKTPGGETSEYLEGGGEYYTLNNLWDNVMFGNFKIGARLYTTYTSTYRNLVLVGCGTGMQIGHKDNHLGFNTSTFMGMDCSGCNIGLQLDNVGQSTFINCTLQGYYDVGLKLNWTFDCTFIAPYFEGVTGNYSIDTDLCANCIFQKGGFSGAENGTTKMRLGANSNNNTIICSALFNTLIIDGYRNEVINGNSIYITDNGFWNVVREFADVSSSLTSNYAVQYTFKNDTNRPGSLAIKNGDLILYSPDGSKFRIKVDNAGAISATKIT